MKFGTICKAVFLSYLLYGGRKACLLETFTFTITKNDIHILLSTSWFGGNDYIQVALQSTVLWHRNHWWSHYHSHMWLGKRRQQKHITNNTSSLAFKITDSSLGISSPKKINWVNIYSTQCWWKVGWSIVVDIYTGHKTTWQNTVTSSWCKRYHQQHIVSWWHTHTQTHKLKTWPADAVTASHHKVSECCPAKLCMRIAVLLQIRRTQLVYPVKLAVVYMYFQNWISHFKLTLIKVYLHMILNN